MTTPMTWETTNIGLIVGSHALWLTIIISIQSYKTIWETTMHYVRHSPNNPLQFHIIPYKSFEQKHTKTNHSRPPLKEPSTAQGTPGLWTGAFWPRCARGGEAVTWEAPRVSPQKNAFFIWWTMATRGMWTNHRGYTSFKWLIME